MRDGVLKKPARYVLIALVIALASGAVYLVGMYNFFFISAFQSTGECTPFILGKGDTIEQLNQRLFYALSGNVALLLFVFAVLSASLRKATSKHHMASFIICTFFVIFLGSTIYDGQAAGGNTISKCTHLSAPDLSFKPKQTP